MKLFAFLLILCTLGLSLLNPWIAVYAFLGLVAGYLFNEDIWRLPYKHIISETFTVRDIFQNVGGVIKLVVLIA
jgi:hypothetical protein